MVHTESVRSPQTNGSMNILIGGTSSGIGRFLTESLLSLGHSIWGFSRSEGNVLEHAQFHWGACDIAKWSDVERLANTVGAEAGALDAIIVCSAVQGPVGRAMSIDPAAWSEAVRVNLDGTFYVLRAFAMHLRRGAGSRAKILCFAGGGASKARPNFSAYAAAKAGVVRLVETMAQEWRNEEIDINAIAPGALSTRMTREILDKGVNAAGEAEIANARETISKDRAGFERLRLLVEFLLSNESDGISGKLISAPWDPWEKFPEHRERLRLTDLLTLRRIVPEDRGESW